MSRKTTDRRSISKAGARVGAVIGAVLIAASALVAAPPASASTAGNACEFAVFIGVRGTNEAAGGGSTHGGRVWTSGGMGNQVSVLANNMASEPWPTYFLSLNYPASTNYEPSVRAGAKALVEELNYLSTACGTRLPAVHLAGFSQGAHVIGDALENKLDPTIPTLTARAKAMVTAVTFFGDPTYGSNYENKIYNNPGSPNATGRLWKIRDQLAQYRKWGWAQYSQNPNASWVPTIRSYCSSQDFFCASNNNDFNYVNHNSYRNTTMGTARTWMSYMTTSF